MTRDAPELRLVSEEVWAQSQARRARTRVRLDTTQGPRPVVRRDLLGARYLLSGFARCATCGWSMTVITRQHGKRRGAPRVPFLGCLSHHKRGPHVCANGRLIALHTADQAVLGALAGEALHPRIITAVVDAVFAQLALRQPRRASRPCSETCGSSTARSIT